MAWNDPNNQNFFTTGWKMFVLGVIVVLVSGLLFDKNIAKPLTAGLDIIGLLLILAAIFVWIVKGIEKSKSKSEDVEIVTNHVPRPPKK